jgi:hypothetical protein
MVLILQKKEGEKEEQKDLKRIHFVYQVRKKYRFFLSLDFGNFDGFLSYNICLIFKKQCIYYYYTLLSKQLMHNSRARLFKY